MRTSNLSVAKYGVGVAIGLLIMGWTAQAYLWYGYMRANPAVGEVSTSPGFQLVYALIFIVGTVIAYTAFSNGLARVLTTDDNDYDETPH